MPVRPLVSILTLGCKLNLADSGAIAARLADQGYATTEHLCEADGFVINTCSVTHVADQKSRKLIRSARRLSPHAPVAVTGCFPRTAGLEAPLDLGADFVAGTSTDDHARIVAFLGERRPSREFTALPVAPGEARADGLRSRAFVKAQEGCNDVCAFCIVPRTRGRERSRDVDAVAADVVAAQERGVNEVVITGTQLGAWGRDFAEPLAPAALIAGLLERTTTPRIRFSSLQPQDITPELLGLWQDPRLMPHFHLALQSGSDRVLAAMRRRYDTRQFMEATDRIRAAVPGVALTTDVITGFPGETEADFEDTLAVCRASGFARVHAFPYSIRQRTTAASLANHIPGDVKRDRMTRLLALAGELSDAFRRSHVGTIRPVLWEEERLGEDGATWHGHTDNYLEVRGVGAGLANRITPAFLREIAGNWLIAGPIGSASGLSTGAS